MFHIRKANRADTADTWTVRCEAIRHQCPLSYSDEQIRIWTSGTFTQSYENDVEDHFHVLVSDERIIGTGMVDLTSGKIDAIFVLPHYMGQGAARQMLEHLETLAVQADLDYLHLDATLNAAPFYRKCGFVGEKVSTYHSPRGLTLDCIPMYKMLRPTGDIPR
ncbi:GNAT family N-acetyltransferase [Pseudomonas luteola]|uniref:GNAT family N-acetyltransferase n=1 Tax=Pseudomonas luteola TaxID=47886 RepID=UPI003A88CADD